jgi:hypothetical protein
MPMFYFHIRSAEEFLNCSEPQPFADLDEARQEAIQAAREIASDDLQAGKSLDLDRIFEITDAEGKILAKVPFAEAVVRTT